MNIPFEPNPAKSAFVLIAVLLAPAGLFSQRSSAPTAALPAALSSPATVKIYVRDSRGFPVDSGAMVRLRSASTAFEARNPTDDAATASFPNIPPGEYEVEVNAVGYRDLSESVSVVSFGQDIPVYVYMQHESNGDSAAPPKDDSRMTPKVQGEMEKGLAAIHKGDYGAALVHFEKATKLSPSNPDILYLLGSAQLALKQVDEAKTQFQNVLKLEPSHQKALVALGEISLQAGDLNSAITALEKAIDANGADWRIQYLLASAYARNGRLEDAEKHALRAANLAKEKGAIAFYLLGEIQFGEHKTGDARETWQHILIEFPNDPIHAKAAARLESSANVTLVPAAMKAEASETLPLPAAMTVDLPPIKDRPWAPADIDDKEYRLADGAACNLNEVLGRAKHRLQSQLMNFEKFAATERIEHQEISRYGVPGQVRRKDFSYIVFVRRAPQDYVYLDENRTGGNDLSNFPTSLASTGLNGMGVSVIQATSRDEYEFRCEGLTSLRGQATWQVRFQERDGANSSTRQWRKDGQLTNIPEKGRFWLSASNYDLVRVETDLIRPIPSLELTMDHLIVDYGPVDFEKGHTKLWLPWSAELFMQLHGRRYHHKHYLTNYMLFGVESDHKIHAPKTSPSRAEPVPQSDPSTSPALPSGP